MADAAENVSKTELLEALKGLSQQNSRIISKEVAFVLKSLNKEQKHRDKPDENKTEKKFADMQEQLNELNKQSISAINVYRKIELYTRLGYEKAEAIAKLSKEEQRLISNVAQKVDRNDPKNKPTAIEMALVNETKKIRESLAEGLLFNKKGWGTIPQILGSFSKEAFSKIKDKISSFSKKSDEPSESEKSKESKIKRPRTKKEKVLTTGEAVSVTGSEGSPEILKVLKNVDGSLKKLISLSPKKKADELTNNVQDVRIVGYLDNKQEQELPTLFNGLVKELKSAIVRGLDDKKPKSAPSKSEPGLFSKLFDALKLALLGGGGLLMGLFKSGFKGIGKLIGSAFNLGVSALKGVGKAFMSLGSKLVKGLGSLLKNIGPMFSRILKSLSGIGSKLIGGLGRAVGFLGRFAGPAAIVAGSAAAVGKLGYETYKTGQALKTDASARENLAKMKADNPQLAKILETKERIEFIKNNTQTDKSKEALKILENKLDNLRKGLPENTPPAVAATKTKESVTSVDEQPDLTESINDSAMPKLLTEILEELRNLRKELPAKMGNSVMGIMGGQGKGGSSISSQSSVVLQRMLNRA